MSSALTIIEDDGCIGIGLDNPQSYLDCFILLFDGDDEDKSLFEDLETAKIFAEIIVKLLRCVKDDIE